MEASRHFGQRASFIGAVTIFALATAASYSHAAITGPIEPPTITISTEAVPDTEWRYVPELEAFAATKDNGETRKLNDDREFDIWSKEAPTSVTIKELEFDPDPFVLNNILITNNTGVTQTYTVGVTLPTVFAAPNLVSGEIHTSVIDGGTDGATLATVPGFPVYTAQIDLLPIVGTLQDHPFSLSASSGSTANDTQTFGPTLNAIAVTNNIGIQLRFTLTAGDTASILSRFDMVNVVPEPGAFILGGMALLGTVVIGRRHRLNRR